MFLLRVSVLRCFVLGRKEGAVTIVNIYRPSKTAMQSGNRKTRQWLLEFEPGAPKLADPLMGWLGSSDTRSQVRLEFDSRESAVTFAERNGLTYRIHEPRARRVHPKSYADNFSYQRVD
ncbi:MAG: ETC complex I subunit [Rhodobacteraceae bacterium]|nr:ETC complex I subunit [Paracoccaceae bacterium]